MSKVRFGVVGLGGIGARHARNIQQERGNMTLAAVCSELPAQAKAVGEELHVPSFTDAQAMFDSSLCDAIVIATPHYWHAPLAIRAARAGLHVLCEKPLAASVGAARAMVSECRRCKVHFGAMLQHRTRPIMKKMKQMVDGGQIGEVHRVSLVTTNWYRTQAYFQSAAWRGTWEDEGGGVMLNQAPHHLDLMQWIVGMPNRIVSLLATRLHNIEVEDTAHALCQYNGGKIAYIYASTADAPLAEHLMICGDKGTLLADRGKLMFGKLKTSIAKHAFSHPDYFQEIPCTWTEVASEDAEELRHMAVVRAFAKHLLGKGKMIATGEDGLNQLELSNAVYLSGYEGRAVDLPVKAAEMDRLLARLAGKSKAKGSLKFRTQTEAELKKLLKKKN